MEQAVSRLWVVLGLSLIAAPLSGQPGPEGQLPPAEFVAEYERTDNLGSWWAAFMRCADEHPWHRQVQRRLLDTEMPVHPGRMQSIARTVSRAAVRCDDRAIADWLFDNLHRFGGAQMYVVARMGAIGNERDQERALALARSLAPESRGDVFQLMTEMAVPTRTSVLLQRMLDAGDSIPDWTFTRQTLRVLGDPEAAPEFTRYLVDYIQAGRVRDASLERVWGLTQAVSPLQRSGLSPELIAELRAAGESLQRRRGG